MLNTSPHGLPHEEAERRLSLYGLNQLPAPQGTPAWRRLLKQLHDPLIYILLATALITTVLREWLDASVILGVVIANAIIGFI